MSAINMLSYFFGFWASIYVINAGLRHCPLTRHWYNEFSDRIGLSIRIMYARLFTTCPTSLLRFIDRANFLPWRLWFSIGVLFSSCCMILSVLMLSLLVYNTLANKNSDKQILTPVLPGVNLPLNHFWLYLLTLLLCTFLHELGHVLAAARERVRLQGFGLFLLGFYPGAYVDLNTADLKAVSSWGQLRIFCAGVWHNTVLAGLGGLMLVALPILLAPAYHLGSGVGVTYLREDSVVTGRHGLAVGDAINQIDSCKVNNQSDWFRCLVQANDRPTGYCAHLPFLSAFDTSGLVEKPRTRSLNSVLPAPLDSTTTTTKSPGNNFDCCSGNAPGLSSSHLCFEYSFFGAATSAAKYACLPARAVTERPTCRQSSDCLNSLPPPPPPLLKGGSGRGANVSSIARQRRSHVTCLQPHLTDSSSRLIKLSHRQQSIRRLPLLFLGPVDDLLASVGVSDYVSKWPYLFPPNAPTYLSYFCMYMVSFSAALALMNVVPCYALDGQYILAGLVDFTLSRLGIRSLRVRSRLITTLTCLGTLLLVANLILAFYFYLANLASTAPSPTTQVSSPPIFQQADAAPVHT